MNIVTRFFQELKDPAKKCARLFHDEGVYYRRGYSKAAAGEFRTVAYSGQVQIRNRCRRCGENITPWMVSKKGQWLSGLSLDSDDMEILEESGFLIRWQGWMPEASKTHLEGGANRAVYEKPQPETLPPSLRQGDSEAIHKYFSLSYANYLTLPRSVLQSMPGGWQEQFVALLEKIDQTIDWETKGAIYSVQMRDTKGKFKRDPFGDYEKGRRMVPHREGPKHG